MDLKEQQALKQMDDWASGGLIVNNSQTSALETNDDNDWYSTEESSQGEKNIFPNNAFEIGKDLDGSIKYTFDSIYQDQNLIKVARDYFEARDGIRYDNEDERRVDYKLLLDSFVL